MKKIFAIFCFFAFGFLSLFAGQTNFAYAQASVCAQSQNFFIVTANFAYIYKESEFSSERLLKLSNKTEISLETENKNPKKYLSSDENFVFFKVENFEGVSGYIYGDLVTKKTEQITAYPNFNAKTSTKCKVFFKEDNVFVESQIELSKNTEIFLYEGYEKKAEYTAISFVYENEVLYGYLPTENISPNGINPMLITCVTVILAALGIIFAWLFIKKKKIKK